MGPMAKAELRKKRFGQLEALHLEVSEDGPTAVIFHGFGADMNDLASLARAVQAPKGTNWVFPNGHLTVPLGGHYEGRAWFPISIAELEKSMATGEAIDWSKLVPPGLKRARENAFELIEKLGVPKNRLLLGGFSQGGMLATDLVLHMDEKPAGLAILSGTLINFDEWSKLATKHAGFSFFQSHGSRDPVLSFAMAERLEKLLVSAGWQGRLLRFEGAHEIPPEVLIQLGAYLRKQLN
jgi:phospholipase/carboxylesterase